MIEISRAEAQSSAMGKWDKLLERVLRGTSDASIPFDDLCGLLERLPRIREKNPW